MIGGDLVLPLRIHPTGLWLMLDVSLAGGKPVGFVLDSGSPASAINRATLDGLITEGRANQSRGRRYHLAEADVGGVRIPDVFVRAGGPTERLAVDGVIGLDYLYQFRRVCVDTAALE